MPRAGRIAHRDLALLGSHHPCAAAIAIKCSVALALRHTRRRRLRHPTTSARLTQAEGRIMQTNQLVEAEGGIFVR